MTKILFVCTGNICRSPTAEAVFRHLVHEAGLSDHFEVDSAGLIANHEGDSADSRTMRAARRFGVEMAEHRARVVQAEDFTLFDWILAMDHNHLRDLQKLAPIECRGKVRLFMSFHPEPSVIDVPDPYYGSPRDFDATFRLIEDGSRALLDVLRRAYKL